MTINIVFLNATGKLDNHVEILEREIENSLKKVSDYFLLADLDITVTPFHTGEECPAGLGGYALSPHREELLIDCERGDVKEVIDTQLLAVLSHEIHHSMRLGLGHHLETLAQQHIMEGLACHFEQTISGGRQPTLFKELQDYDWQMSLSNISPLLSEKDHSFEKLFLGSHPEEYPKYAGYWIGFKLVSQYVLNNTASDTDFIGMEADKFFDGVA
ncbi:MAG: DUF2268 domain-containing putative Zn-dependent protease [Gammaproteobacteria bacterium]|nr:DUF2268 domain-containing putative Zn-dependent protease [Gammaproteobacteria bacterium]